MDHQVYFDDREFIPLAHPAEEYELEKLGVKKEDALAQGRLYWRTFHLPGLLRCSHKARTAIAGLFSDAAGSARSGCAVVGGDCRRRDEHLFQLGNVHVFLGDGTGVHCD